MTLAEILPPELEDSSMAESIRALYKLYAEIETATSAFKEGARKTLALAHPGENLPRLGCPDGCGACCERFLPDILPVEADYAALWILAHKPELAERTREPRNSPPCPFYDKDRLEAHCSIYPARPLICRLFVYSGITTKEGLTAYSLCWAIPDPQGQGKRSWVGEEILEELGSFPPLMADYGLRLHALAPETPGTKPFLGEAIGRSLNRLSFLLSVARREGELAPCP